MEDNTKVHKPQTERTYQVLEGGIMYHYKVTPKRLEQYMTGQNVSDEAINKLREEWLKCYPGAAQYRTPIIGAVNHLPFTFVPSSGKTFDPQIDLPKDPRPGDMCQGADGSFWYAIDSTTWAQFSYDYAGNAMPMGRQISVVKQAVTSNTIQQNSVQNSKAKTPTCASMWDHKWKTYVGLTGINSFEYCEVCDEKRK